MPAAADTDVPSNRRRKCPTTAIRKSSVAWVNGIFWMTAGLRARSRHISISNKPHRTGDTPVAVFRQGWSQGWRCCGSLGGGRCRRWPGPTATAGKVDNLASTFVGASRCSHPDGSRVMRREFGGGIAELLGRLMTPALFAAWRQLVATAIDLWEPRFRVRKVMLDGSTEALRLGSAHMTIEAEFRPRGHLGDFTVERVVTFGIDFGQRVRVT